jgi:hypothetical protein
MASIQGGSNTINVADVDADFNLKVALPTGDAFAGKVRIMSENDPGNIIGEPYLKSPETSADYRLRVGTDSLFDNDYFNYAAQNTTKHKYTNTTLTMTYGGGFLTTNGGSITTTTTAAVLQTYRHFPVFGASSTYCHTSFSLTAQPTTNTIIDIGLFTPGAANPYAPTDGVFFRITSAGIFGVININGTEVTTSALNFTFTLNTVYEFIIVLDQDKVEFWINEQLYAILNTPIGNGAPSYAGSLPFAVRHAIVGGAAGAVLQLKLANYHVSIADFAHNRLWASVQAGMGNNAIQGASGMTQAQTANATNSAAPASATLSNTAAGYTTLGGQWQFAAVLGAETDYALFAYLNTVPTTAITGRNLVIRGVWIESLNTVVAVATTATVLQWSLGVGSTAVSLATAEAATTRAPRRIMLGLQTFPVGATVGATAARIDVNLDAPVVVEPGTYFHVILKVPIGTATATEIFRGIVGVNAYWE